MIRSILRVLCCLLFCALLVYAPELYSAVSTQYNAEPPRRILLRVSLCAPDADTEKSILRTLQLYMKEFPSIHLRITCRAPDQLFSQPDPQADLFVFPSNLPHSSPSFQRIDSDGQMQYAIHADTRESDAAYALLSHLLAASTLDSAVNSAL